MPTVSIIIPTLGRSDSLRDCLESLWSQSYQDYEILQVTEEGELAELRNYGSRRAQGRYLIFIDDDVVCSKHWLRTIVSVFERSENIVGVSGPSTIMGEYRRNRDIFRYYIFKWLYDLIFCGGRRLLPGHITKAGAWTTGAANQSCSYDGEVHFLEACNMAFRTDIFRDLGGFDEAYRGVGDWSEPDLSFRVRRAGFKLWFSRDAVLEHRPSRSGAFKKRKADARNRLANYNLFASRWVAPCWQHTIYRWFLNVYYTLATR